MVEMRRHRRGNYGTWVREMGPAVAAVLVCVLCVLEYSIIHYVCVCVCVCGCN